MNARNIIPLIAIGALLGAAAHWVKSDSDNANRIIRDLPQRGYEACQELNALLIAAGEEQELRDCESEYLE